MSEAKMRVYWLPQIPCKPFYVIVDTLEEGVKMMDTLADYDAFQFEKGIKADYCNAGGIEVRVHESGSDLEGEWEEWFMECEWGYFDDPREYLQAINNSTVEQSPL